MKTKQKPLIPSPVVTHYKPHQLDDKGWWLIINDLHIKYHDVKTIELAVATAIQHKAIGVLINGDLLDHHRLSKFDHERSAPRYKEEIDAGKQFLKYLRGKLPKARIVFKLGNHDERLRLYVIRKAEELSDLEEITLQSLLGLRDLGIECVEDKRVVRIGPLNCLHGHEFPQGASQAVNPARGLFLRAKSVAICAHHHQTSEHHEPDVTGKPLAAWSVGCACHLNPQYMPLNKWNHGFAMVQLASSTEFLVRNLRVIDGKVY